MTSKQCLLVAVILLLCACTKAQEEGSHLRVQFSSGFDQQKLHWSIAGNSAGQNPNIYSELKWREVSGPKLQLSVTGSLAGHWRFFADGSRVFTQGGRVSDTDYGADNRSDAVYGQTFDSRKGYSYTASAGIGYALIDRLSVRIYAYIGYSVDGQIFSIRDPDGLYSFLNSGYTTKWEGPMVKIASEGGLGRNWGWDITINYQQVKYEATADWNLIASFAHPLSFRQTADGYGLEMEGGLRYQVNPRIQLRFGGGYFTWQTGKGIDKLYLSAGGTDQTQLNGVSRTGWHMELGLALGLGKK